MSKNSSTQPFGLRRNKPGLLRLEPRLMFDGAAPSDALEVMSNDEIARYIAPAAIDDSLIDARDQEAIDFAETERQASAEILSFLAGEDATEKLFSILHGNQSEPSAAWLERAEQLLELLRGDDYSVSIRFLDATHMPDIFAAFTAEGPGGEPTIFINKGWWNQAEPEQRLQVLIEEYGHSFDHFLNPGQDTAGDEGEALAVAVLGIELNFLEQARIAVHNDYASIVVDGEEFVVEAASFSFVNAYEMLYDLNNNNQIDNTERWADKEQNTHYFNTARLGPVSVLDDVNSRYFSGNDVSAIGLNIAGTDYFGWISRPIKSNGIVRGFYFWTDADFVNLATAQADGNQDGDRNVSDNRGFLLVLDQTWFDAQINKTKISTTINNLKDGNLGLVEYAVVGSSSDRVDSALNALIFDNTAPVANPDILSGDAGTTITGNVLTNDTDADNDPLEVTQFVVGGQTYSIAAGGSTTANLAGIGSLTISRNGDVSFVPDAGYSGNLPAVTYTISDGEASASSVLSIIVNAVNDPPVSTNDTLAVDTGTPTLLSLGDFGQYSDPNNDPLAFVRIISLPATGLLEHSADGTTWTAVSTGQQITAADINAGRLRYSTQVVTNAVIGFAVSDGKDYSVQDYTLTLTVSEGPPAANNITAPAAIEAGLNPDGSPVGAASSGSILPIGSSLTLTFIGNTPVAASGDTVIQGLYGTLTVRADGSYTYAPNNQHPAVDALNVGQSLTESFGYTVANADGLTASALLNVSIQGSNDAPVANPDAAALKELTAQHPDGHYGQVNGNVLSNDSDVDHTQNTLKVVIGDSDLIPVSTVSIPASATSPITATTYSVEEAGGNNWTSVISNSTYASFEYQDSNNNWQTAKKLDGTTNLLVIRSGSGVNATLIFDETAALYQFPVGTVFRYISGNTALFRVGITSVTVALSNQITVTAGDINAISNGYLVSGTGIPDGTTVTSVSGNTVTLSQQVQIQNRELTFTDPNSANAPVAGPNEMLLAGTYGYLRISQDGSFTYTLTDNSLNAGDVRTEIFNYRATDDVNVSNQSTLTITVNGTSGAPGFSVANDSFTTNEDEPLTSNLLTNDTNATTITGFIWGNESGTVGAPLTIAGIGTLTIESNGSLSFTPAANYNGPVPVITYTASAGGAERASATATITITPVNDPPVSTNDEITVAINTPTLLTLSDFGAYSDVDDDPLHSIRITQLPASGSLQKLDGLDWVAVVADDVFTVSDITDGKLRYITAANATAGHNYASLDFKVNDGTVDSVASYTLTINVIQPAIPFGDPPINTVPAGQTVPNHESLSITGLSVDDPNDDIATVTLSVSKGSLTVTVAGGAATDNGGSTIILSGSRADINAMLATLIYTPNQGSVGEDTLRIHSVDDTNRSATSFVAIDVTADNRPLIVTGSTVNEASPYLMFQVAGETGQRVSLELAATGNDAGHATIGQDVLPAIEYFDGTHWQSYTHGALIAIPAGGTTLLVRAAVLQDDINEGAETLKLIARNTNNVAFDGIGSIIDNGTGSIFLGNNPTFSPNLPGDTDPDGADHPVHLDDDRPVTVNNIAVNEASPYAIFTVAGANGQNLQLALEAGTARLASALPVADGSEDFGPALEVWDGSAWLTYTPGDTVSIGASGTLLVRTVIIDDNLFEGQEGFSLAVTKLSSTLTTVRGIASIYDDGTGDVYLGTNITGEPNGPADSGYPVLDDDRSLAFATSNVDVNENSDLVIFTLTGNPGQTVTLELINSSNNGTVIGKANIPDVYDGANVIKIYMGVDTSDNPIWEAYDPTKALPTFDEAGKLFIAVDIRAEQDALFEGPETFELKATLAHQVFDDDLTPADPGWLTNLESTRPDHTVIATATIWDDGSKVIFTGKIDNALPETSTSNLDDDRPAGVLLVNDIVVAEDAGFAVFSINGTANQFVTLRLQDGTAEGLGVDYGEPTPGSSQLEVSTDGGLNWVVYSNNAQLNGNGSLLARTPIIDDMLVENNETFKLLVRPISEVAATFPVFDVDRQEINLQGLVLRAGTAGQAGAEYIKANGINIAGQAIDIVIRIDARSNVTSFVFDNDSPSSPVGSVPARFQPEINSSSSSGSYVDFTMTFFRSGTTERVALENFLVSAVDIDGTSTSQEFVELSNFSSYQLGQTSGLTVAPGTRGDGFTRFGGLTTTIAGIPFEDTGAMVAIYADPVAEVGMRLGNTGSASTARLFSISFGASIGNFANPNTVLDDNTVIATATIIDNDTAGLTLSKTTLITSENGTSDSFTVVLDSQPASDVSFTITGLDSSEGSLNTTTVTFTPLNWNIAQTVTVTGADDPLIDGTQSYTLTLTASSGDPNYNGQTATVAVSNLDNDITFGGDITGVGAEDTVIAGSLTATIGMGLHPSTPFAVTIVPSNGTATIDANGAWTFTPNPDWHGTDSFTVTVTDAQGFTSTQHITVTVTPVADITDDSLTTAEDTPISFNPVTGTTGATADSFDGLNPQITAINGTALTAGGPAVAVAHGTVSLGAGNVLTFSPAANYAGPASFTYTVSSGGVTETATVNVTVTPVDDGPSVVLSGNSGSGAEDTPVTGTLVVTDPDGLAASPFSLSADPAHQPANGTASINAATGAWTFTPNPDWHGTDSFTVTVTDAQGFTSTQLITVTVTPVADITDDSLTTAEDTPISFNPVTGTAGATADSFDGLNPQITAINGTALTAGGSAVAVAHGTVSLGAGNVLTFSPAANYAGPASFTYTVSSGGVTETATVNVTVTPVDDGPSVVLSGNSGSGAEDTPVTGTLVVTDPDGLAASPFSLSANPAHQPANGTASIDPTTGAWTFTPNPDWNGTDSFTVTVTDAQGFTSTQVISITVTPVADITDDSLTTAEDTPISFNPVTGTAGVTADSFDGLNPQITAINGTALTAGGPAVAVAHGTVSLGAGNVLTFSPAANYAGPASFTYTVSSGGVTETATVNVTVTPVDDGPSVVLSGNSGSGAEDTPVTGTLVVTDPDGLPASPFSLSANPAHQPANGTASIDPTTGAWTFTPNPDWNGTDSFTVTVTDAQGFTSTQLITVTVTPVADITDDSLTTAEDTPISFNPVTGTAGVTADSFDGLNPQITAINGTALTAGGPAVAVAHGTVSLGAGNVLTFSPAANYAGPASFTYTVSSGGVTETATVNVTVTPVDDGPSVVLSGNSGSGAEDTPVTGTLVVTDPDGLAASPFSLSANPAHQPANGTASIDPTTGAWTFTPNPDWNGTDSFTVTVTDAQGFTSTQVITVTVMPVQDAVDDTATTISGQSVTIDVLDNDSFDASPVSIIAVSAPSNGTAVLNPDGSITYTAKPGFVGTEIFTYTASSPSGTPETVTVRVLVTAAPVKHVEPAANNPLPPAAPRPPANVQPTPTFIAPDFRPPEPPPWDSFTRDESVGGSHELRVERDIPLQAVQPGGELRLTIPADTFSHTDQQATLALSATMLDGSPLPSWLRFDPATGGIVGTPPPDFQGEAQIRVVARDQVGRQAETIVSIQAAANASNNTPGSTQTTPQNPMSQRDVAPAGATNSGNPGTTDRTTTTSGFIVRVDPAGAVDGQHNLRVDKGIPELTLSEAGAAFSYQIPIDAFVHTDADAEIILNAVMLDGSDLPPWLRFDAEKGELNGVIPDDFDNELIIRVIARDKDGRQTETLLRILRTGQAQQAEAPLEGRPELNALFSTHGVLGWRAEQEALVRLALEAAEQVADVEAS